MTIRKSCSHEVAITKSRLWNACKWISDLQLISNLQHGFSGFNLFICIRHATGAKKDVLACIIFQAKQAVIAPWASERWTWTPQVWTSMVQNRRRVVRLYLPIIQPRVDRKAGPLTCDSSLVKVCVTTELNTTLGLKIARLKFWTEVLRDFCSLMLPADRRISKTKEIRLWNVQQM